jgi:hypothetical protein
MANQNKQDRNKGQQSGRRDELGSERNRDMTHDEQERSRKQREGNLGNERNRESENIRNRGDESGRSRRTDASRLPD